ncbi:aminodeoxychorismate synthase component I [Neolewinella antarctica]|uniref:Para-aminobenzoate synthetase component 1 n=1 Tax=Neolewinella antarctica TaxID=442734 RepID=A0ABX0X652_9BACT|nr:aminodeoxychorismate synthase component I [Neolewinella antarctica]NJC24560.1 para-aminobenzoate synthetase component 1 [Neolewinella antarctica]
MRGTDDKISTWASQLNALGAKGTACFFLVDFEMERPEIWTLDDPDCPSFTFPDRDVAEAVPAGSTIPRLYPEHISREAFRTAFDTVQAGLQRGDSFLTNLTFPVPVQLNCGLEDVYHYAQAKYRILVPNNFVCFSPETFVTISSTGHIESRPMKGTTVNTQAGRHQLLRSSKEIAEHATIVDLIRNDLSIVASKVRVTDYRYFHEISTSRRGLVQTSSNVGGQLAPDWRERMGDILRQLLPAGSISGAPKTATLDIIRAAEGQARGYYCGIAGHFDGEQLDTCVLIRLIEERAPGIHYFRSGGGITARSRWEDELHELKSKVRIPLRKIYQER